MNNKRIFLLPIVLAFAVISVQVAVAQVFSAPAEDKGKCTPNADIAFLVDSSGSISRRNYRKVRQFVSDLGYRFNISPGGSRAAVVVYSTSASTDIRFTDHTSSESFARAVQRLRHQRGFTRIDLALQRAYNDLFGRRGTARLLVPKIAFVLTDGEQTQASGAMPLDRASGLLKAAGVRLIVIGVGRKVNKKELEMIASSDDDVIISDNFDTLLAQVQPLIRTACEGIEVPPPCQFSTDITFLVDSSKNIGKSEFSRQKTFLKIITKSFGNNSRSAVVTYGEKASIFASFDQFPNIPDFLKAVANLTQDTDGSGNGRLDEAVNLATRDVFPKSRPGVSKLAVVLTDGKQAIGPHALELKQAFETSRKAGIRMHPVGFDKKMNVEEWSNLVERKQGLLQVDNFQDLTLKAHEVAASICRAAEPIEQPTCGYAADLTFILDSSDSISTDDYLKQKSLIISIARSFGISHNTSRAAVVQYSDSASVYFQLGDSSSTREFETAVHKMPHKKGPARIEKAFDVTVTDVLPYGRTGIPQIAFVLTNGKHASEEGVKALDVASKQLRRAGMKVIALGVGTKVDPKELSLMVDNEERVLRADAYDELILDRKNVSRKICQEAAGTPQKVRHGLFLVDSSAYRSKSDYESQLDFIKSISKRLNVSPTGTRAGVILYGDEPQLSVGLYDYSTLQEFYSLLDDLKFQRGGRSLHKALTLAGQTLQKSSQALPNFVVIFVEGQQYLSSSLVMLRNAVKPLQALGVTVFVVGIGNRLNSQELVSMVQNSKHIVRVTGFAELLRQVESIVQLIDFTITATCKETIDVGFLMDASGNIGLENFSREKNFVKLVSRRFAATSPNTRLGLIAFSDTPNLFVDLGNFERKTIDQFQATVDQVPFQGGRSRIDLALRAASQDLFTNRRSGVSRVLILVSDGRQSKDPGYYPLATAIKPLQAQRVKVLAVGFGDNVNTRDLKVITGSNDRILSEQETGNIDRLQRELVSKACIV